jgi:ribulose-phosphate 3-epimerase
MQSLIADMASSLPARLAPSMMCADILALGAELATFVADGVEWLHLDVMDGRFVPNLTLGPDVCRALARGCAIPQDVHLMVEEPERFLPLFAGLPGARLSFHAETTRHPPAVIAAIRAQGASPGLALSPATPVEAVRHLLALVDQVTVMTVNPGFAGQPLLDWCLPKLTEVRAWADVHRPQLDVAVDGNVSWANLPRMRAAGANHFVLGTSSLFQRDLGRSEALRRIRALLAG